MSAEDMKRIAGEKAAEYVKDGMVVGLGTGSTVYYTILKLGEMVKDGLDIIGIPTSIGTERLARELGIKISTLYEHPEIDLTIDGADEIDPELNLIKGGGGALLREKIVASASKMEIIVADERKLVDKLGERFHLPVEVIPFSYSVVFKRLDSMGLNPVLRKKNGEIYITDNGNYIIDCHTGPMENPEELEKDLNMIPGVVENGLFIGLAHMAIVGTSKNKVKEFRRIS